MFLKSVCEKMSTVKCIPPNTIQYRHLNPFSFNEVIYALTTKPELRCCNTDNKMNDIDGSLKMLRQEVCTLIIDVRCTHYKFHWLFSFKYLRFDIKSGGNYDFLISIFNVLRKWFLFYISFYLTNIIIVVKTHLFTSTNI